MDEKGNRREVEVSTVFGYSCFLEIVFVIVEGGGLGDRDYGNTNINASSQIL